VSKQQKIEALQRMISDAGIEHFSARELGRLNANAWSGDSFALPDADHLERIIPTLKLADEIRERWCAPVLVISGYRPAGYNQNIGGKDESQHKYFRALDIRPAREPFDLERYFNIVRSVVYGAREDGQNVGLGLYYDGRGRFAHIDVGAHTGENRQWERR